MPQYVIIADHTPDICPSSNAKVRAYATERMGQIPKLAEEAGVRFEVGPLHLDPGHRSIAERNAREVMAALTPLRGTNCDKLSGEATRLAEQIVAGGRARNRAYDVQTKHGQTQGVVLPP